MLGNKQELTIVHFHSQRHICSWPLSTLINILGCKEHQVTLFPGNTEILSLPRQAEYKGLEQLPGQQNGG